jgi:hypothetical protein
MSLAPLTTPQVIVQGDDYKAAESRALQWHSPSYPNLAGASLELIAGQLDSEIYGNLPVVWKTTIPASPETRTASVELTHVQTSEVAEGTLDYLLRAILPDGSRITLAAGPLSVIAPPAEASLMP